MTLFDAVRVCLSLTEARCDSQSLQKTKNQSQRHQKVRMQCEKTSTGARTPPTPSPGYTPSIRSDLRRESQDVDFRRTFEHQLSHAKTGSRACKSHTSAMYHLRGQSRHTQSNPPARMTRRDKNSFRDLPQHRSSGSSRQIARLL